jgi:hypothetical protein
VLAPARVALILQALRLIQPVLHSRHSIIFDDGAELMRDGRRPAVRGRVQLAAAPAAEGQSIDAGLPLVVRSSSDRRRPADTCSIR